MPQDAQQPPNTYVAGTIGPQAFPASEPATDLSVYVNERSLPYQGPRFEVERPESFNRYHNESEDRMEAHGWRLLRGEGFGPDFWRDLLRFGIGEAIDSGATNGMDNYERMDARRRGEEVPFRR